MCRQNTRPLDLELDRAEESKVPWVGLTTREHLEASGDTLVKSARRGQTLEGALREVDMILLAASALIYDTDLGALVRLVVAKTNKIAARRSVLPALHHSADVVVVFGIPASFTASRLLQVVRGIPGDLDIVRPNVLKLLGTVSEQDRLVLLVATGHAETGLATDVERALFMLLSPAIITNTRVKYLDLVAVLVEKVFVSTSNSDKCDQRKNGTKSKLDKARHIQ